MFLKSGCIKAVAGRSIRCLHRSHFTEARDHALKAVHIENEFVRVMVLPEIGGPRAYRHGQEQRLRLFFYRQNVIKPALVGLAGPWISGRSGIQLAASITGRNIHAGECSYREQADGSRYHMVQRS